MKKQVVLILSILVAAMSFEVQSSERTAPTRFGKGARHAVVPNNTPDEAPTKPAQNQAQVPTVGELVADGVDLGDLAEALSDMKVQRSGNKANSDKVQAFIKGQPVSGNQNKSHKLGRLSK